MVYAVNVLAYLKSVLLIKLWSKKIDLMELLKFVNFPILIRFKFNYD